MALSKAVGSFTGNDGTEPFTQDVSLSFDPKLVIIYGAYASEGVVEDANAAITWGAADSTNQIAGFWRGNDNAAASADDGVFSDTDTILGTTGSGFFARADCAMGTSKFTLTWTDKSVGSLYYYLALGGDITVEVGTFTIATAAGTGDKTVTLTNSSLTPKLVMLLYGRDGQAFDETEAVHYFFGLGATDGTNQWTCSIVGEDAQTGSDTGRVLASDHCLEALDIAGASDYSMKLPAGSAFAAGSFTLNVDAAPGADTVVGYIAIGGNVSALVGVGDQKTSAGTLDYTTTGITPEFLMLASVGALNTGDGTPGANCKFSFGAADGTTNKAISAGENDNSAGNTRTHRRSSANAITHEGTAATPTTAAEATLSSFAANKYTLNWASPDANARRHGHIVLAAAAAGATIDVPAGQQLYNAFTHTVSTGASGSPSQHSIPFTSFAPEILTGATVDAPLSTILFNPFTPDALNNDIDVPQSQILFTLPSPSVQIGEVPAGKVAGMRPAGKMGKTS